MKAQSEKKHGSDKEERGKLPESPKTAEEIWQQSVIGDYLARFKVRSGPGSGIVASASRNCLAPSPLLPRPRQRVGAGSRGEERGPGEGCPVVCGGASGSTPASPAPCAHL